MAATGFDQSEIYFSDPFGSDENANGNISSNTNDTRKKFKDFIKDFHEVNFVFPYRYILITCIYKHKINN